MWSLSATAQSSATVERVWEVYRDVARWPLWDRGMALYRPDGPFVTGTNGILQPVGGPELPFTLVLVEERQRFVDRTPVGPDAAIIGRHELVAEAQGTRITHTVEIDGPDAEGLAQAFGFKQEELQETVDALAQYAEPS